MRMYVLKGHEVVPTNNTLEWSKGLEKDRHVGLTEIGKARVSTVFLGLDHRFVSAGPPLIFETLVFGGELDGKMERCSTWAEAERMHEAMVERVRSAESAGSEKAPPQGEIPE